jgi:PmbA protein
MPIPKAIQRRMDGLIGLAEFTLDTLKQLGVDHAEVGIGHGSELEVSVRQGKVDLVKEAQSSGLSVRVVRDGKVATSSTTNLDRDALSSFLANALQMASLGEEDPLVGPPEPSELAKKWKVLDLFDPRTDRIRAERAVKIATAAEQAAFRSDRRITTSDGASFSRSSGVSVLATTAGFLGHNAGTYQSIVVQAVADDEGGKKRNGVYWTGGRFLSELEKPAEVGREAARRAVRFLGASKMESGKVPVVFDKEAGRAIVGLVASCILGDSVYRERSYMAGKLGKRVASSAVTIVDDPRLARSPGSRSYDGEGRPVRRHTVIDGGELKTFLMDTYSARKLKMRPTGSASGGGGVPHSSTSNFFMKKGRVKPATLLKGIDNGLYVVRMMGFGFDPVTGSFSRGAEGFRIVNGELAEPVGEITISRNLDDLLRGIDLVANDLEHKTSVTSPSFRVDEMTVAGR